MCVDVCQKFQILSMYKFSAILNKLHIHLSYLWIEYLASTQWNKIVVKWMSSFFDMPPTSISVKLTYLLNFNRYSTTFALTNKNDKISLVVI